MFLPKNYSSHLLNTPMGIDYSKLCFTTEAFTPIKRSKTIDYLSSKSVESIGQDHMFSIETSFQDLPKTLPYKNSWFSTFVQHGPSKYECKICHQHFKTQDNAESHFWCFTKTEFDQLLQKNRLTTR